MRVARGIAGIIGVALCALTGAHASQITTAEQPALWTGTITVTRTGSGSPTGGGDAGVQISATERVTWTLNGDGSASFIASFEERQTWTSGGVSLPIVISGSGSGLGAAGAERIEPDATARAVLGIGPGWILGAMLLDPIRVREDRTGFDGPVQTELGKLVAALSLSQQAPPPPSLDDSIIEREHSPDGIEIPISAPASAKTLSGSATQAGIVGSFSTPATVTITWNLTRAAVPTTPRVTIRGPACTCLDAQDPSRTPVRFTAFATAAGGEFSEFTVRPEGAAPEIVENSGGDRPALEFQATRESDVVTLNIEYRWRGRVYRAPPVRVEFCTLDAVELDGNRADLAFDAAGVLTAKARTRAWHNGREVSPAIEWSIDPLGTPTRVESEPPDARGERIQFRYLGLPTRNSDFGPRAVTSRFRGGQCDCTAYARIRVFFNPTLDGHPAADGTPNWFYYWRQTRAVPDAVRRLLRFEVQPTDRDGNPTLALYEHESETITLGDDVIDPRGCRAEVSREDQRPTGRQNQGIDCFGETVRHEVQHRTDAIEWWGSPKGMFSVGAFEALQRDTDLDHVPNLIEAQYAGCSRFSKTSCPQRPFSDVTDGEIRAYYAGWSWPTSSADREDWSCGPLAKQWRGGACP